jgi:hypothetical protein
LTVKEPGPFEAQITIYLEDNGTRERVVTVRGVAVGGEGDAKP